MPETTLPVAAAPHTNHQLFSDHPLNHTRHEQHTGMIIGREADLNARVYALFGLAAGEIALIEAATKYHYGEV